MEEYKKIKTTIKDWDEADRPREKLMNLGRQSLTNAELLAIILGGGNKEKNAVELAKEILLSVNNNLSELSKLSYKDFCNRFKGIGPAKAIGIVAALELGYRRRQSTTLQRPIINSSSDAYDAIAHYLLEKDVESFFVMLLSNNNKLIRVVPISHGGINETLVDRKIVFKVALENNAVKIILAHNHPSGETKPSQADINTTRTIVEAGKIMSIQVLDHLIIGEDDRYYSFLDNGMI
ncbi:MAG: DNA repair protein RadC [Bacteroidales bacterium]|jgi:DNA repair protein RadC|nr:DNA repair protein RadC [Bacteroidales bacterium]MEE1225618.1 DNA repair protein RadC [Bacteroidales bacterium]